MVPRSRCTIRQLVPGATGERPKRGCSEIHLGRLRDGSPVPGDDRALARQRGGRLAGGRGRSRSSSAPRTVLDTTLADGHALWVADVDGDGDDEVFAGHRGKDHRVSMYDFDRATNNLDPHRARPRHRRPGPARRRPRRRRHARRRGHRRRDPQRRLVQAATSVNFKEVRKSLMRRPDRRDFRLRILMCWALAASLPAGQGHAQAPGPAQAGPVSVARQGTIWPGLTPAGTVLLPNGWSLKPAGRQTRLGDLPVQIAVHPSEPVLAVLHAGYGEHEVVTARRRDRQGHRPRRPARDFAGLVWSADGKQLYAGGGFDDGIYRFDHAGGLLSNKADLRLSAGRRRIDRVPGGLALSADGKTLWVANVHGHSVGPARRRDRHGARHASPSGPIPIPTAWPGTKRADGST